MRDLNNIDIKDIANGYSIENNPDNYEQTRDAYIDGFNYCLEEVQKQYTPMKLQYLGKWVQAMVKTKEI